LTPLQQSRLFDRGNGLPDQAARVEDPTGFGLLVAKAFMDRMHGRLWSENIPGRGACFMFRLPYHPPKET
jgi:signal transduction histidine kinase